MALSDIYKEFEKEFDRTWNKYVELHKALDKFRGLEITEKNVGTINKIISELQDTFAQLHTTINFVLHRAPLCQQAITEYNKFIDDIKASGATPENEVIIREPTDVEASA